MGFIRHVFRKEVKVTLARRSIGRFSLKSNRLFHLRTESDLTSHLSWLLSVTPNSGQRIFTFGPAGVQNVEKPTSQMPKRRAFRPQSSYQSPQIERLGPKMTKNTLYAGYPKIPIVHCIAHSSTRKNNVRMYHRTSDDPHST